MLSCIHYPTQSVIIILFFQIIYCAGKTICMYECMNVPLAPPRLRLLVLFWAWSGKWPDENTLGPDGVIKISIQNKKEPIFI